MGRPLGTGEGEPLGVSDAARHGLRIPLPTLPRLLYCALYQAGG